MVIDPTGALHTRTVDDRIAIDEWNTPYQVSLWKAVHHEVDPYRGAVNGVGLTHGLRAKVARRGRRTSPSDRTVRILLHRGKGE